jgi:hypothetical protein
MNTEITFLDHPGDGVRKSHVIRTGSSAIVTSDTAVGVNHDDTIFSLIGCSYRTHGITDRALTMVAQPRKKKH